MLTPMTISELKKLKKTVIRNKRNLEFSTKISTEDLLHIIELAERELIRSSSPRSQESDHLPCDGQKQSDADFAPESHGEMSNSYPNANAQFQ